MQLASDVQVDLTGRVVLVTGASSGIGASVARAAAMSGAKVALAARRVDHLKRLAEEIVDAGGVACAVPMDVTDEQSTKAAYDAVEEALGPVESVIANAGVGYRGRATEMNLEDFDRLMAINVRGVFITACEGARRMIARGAPEDQRGRIVIISSATAVAVTQSSAAYSASKAAALQLGKCLARDWIRLGVNVNVVLPGYIHTELNDALFTTGAGDKMLESFPRQRLMQESDINGIILYLASDAARAFTGASITIDDGQML